MRITAKYFAMLVLLLLIPRSTLAQASLTGVVRDSSGAVVPGVTVEAASPALIEKVRSAVTDSAGLYRIVDLRPGTYTLTFSLPGFSTVLREGLELAGSITLTIPAVMRVGGVEETVTVSGASPVVDVQNARTQTVLNADVIAALPATRAYGSLLNAISGLTVDNNGLAVTPTMTFFSSHGGPSNEGKVQINGMTVGAASGGGGVGTLTYDTNSAEETSVMVSGGLGESETGGPVMNLVPRSGGNTFRGAIVLQHRRRVVERHQRGRFPARHRHRARRRRHQCVRRQRLARRADQARPDLVLRQLPQADDGSGRRGDLRQRLRVRRDALGLLEEPEPFGARRAGPHLVSRAGHGAGHAQESRDVRPAGRVPLPGLVRVRERRRLPLARRRLGGHGIDHVVSRGERPIFRFPVLAHPGDLDGDGDEPAAGRSRLQPAFVPRWRGNRIAGRGLRLDPGRRAVGH